MISRIWHGYTTPENADIYENLLKQDIIVGIRGRNIEGFKEIQVFRRPLDDEVEFVTIMWFDSIDSVRQFAGDDYGAAYVPQKAREILAHFDDRSQHYEVREHVKGS